MTDVKRGVRDRRRYALTPEKRRASHRRWYLKHRERERARSRVRYLLTRTRELAKKRDANLANPEIVRLRNQRWSLAHPESGRIQWGRRRARLAGAIGKHTAQEWLAKCALLGNVCFYCGEAKPLTIDHKVPLTRGGSNDIANILPACISCNARKRVKTVQEFLAT